MGCKSSTERTSTFVRTPGASVVEKFNILNVKRDGARITARQLIVSFVTNTFAFEAFDRFSFFLFYLATRVCTFVIARPKHVSRTFHRETSSRIRATDISFTSRIYILPQNARLIDLFVCSSMHTRQNQYHHLRQFDISHTSDEMSLRVDDQPQIV